jgi:FkbM family methyltransferase
MGPLINLARRIKYRLEGRYRPAIQHRCAVDFIGSDYGGYGVCPTSLPPEPNVYSFGIGQDISFDRGMIQKYNARVFAFDPTAKSHAWLRTQQLPAEFQWFDYGIGVQDGVLTFFPPKNPAFVSHSVIPNPYVQAEGIALPVKRLATIARELGHSRIDILKLDIEEAEYDVIPDVLNTPGVSINQILVEFHHRFTRDGVAKTERTINLLNQYGFQLFWVSLRSDVFSFIRTGAPHIQ